jgi:hypothetical protein
MNYIKKFKAREDFVLVHKKEHLYGEVVYSTEEFPYEKSDFKEVPRKDLEKIIQKWMPIGSTNTTEV